jgi:endoglucanase
MGAKNAEEVKKLVANGDPITFKLGVTELANDKIVSPGCDDKVGVYVVMEAMRLVSNSIIGSKKKNFPVAIYAVSTVQEEIGLRGARTSAFGIDPLVGIAVDVTHASDNPGAEAKKIGTMKLGEGAGIARGPNINPVLEKLILETAKKKKIPVQTYAAPGATGTDANAIQINRSGVAAALVSLPNRYMHTPVEMVNLKDLDIAAKLIAETIMSISAKMDFIPS